MLRIFLAFVKLGFFSFGGGYTFMSLMQSELVDKTRWLTNPELVLSLAIGQVTPGPVAVAGSFAGFLIGYKMNLSLMEGLLYALIAWIGTNVASVLSMGIIMRYYKKIAGHPAIPFSMGLVMPAVIAVIMYLAMKIAQGGMNSIPQAVICVLAFLVAMFSKIDYIFIIIAGGLAGYFLMR